MGGGGTKTAKKGWDVHFDTLPHDDNVIKNISRNKLSVLSPGEEEDPMNEQRHQTQVEQLQEIQNEEEEKKKKTSPML